VILLGDKVVKAHIPLKIHASTLTRLKMSRDHYPHDLAGEVIGRYNLMSFICASVINHDITKVMGQ
jgi:hypothetical protein